MLTDADHAEIRSIVNEVVGAHLRAAADALSPVADVLTEIHKFGDLLLEIQRSIVLVVQGQARIESALQSFRADDADEPWRQSLADDEDVTLDQDD